MPDVELDLDKEFARIKLMRLESRDRWKVLKEECPVRVEGRAERCPSQFTAPIQWPELSRCASGIDNLDGDRSSMEYCLYGYCPKIM